MASPLYAFAVAGAAAASAVVVDAAAAGLSLLFCGRRSRCCSAFVFWLSSAAAAGVDEDDVVAAVVCISAKCAVAAPSPHAVVVDGAAVELRPAVVVDCDTAAVVDIAVDQIFSPCCPHTP